MERHPLVDQFPNLATVIQYGASTQQSITTNMIDYLLVHQGNAQTWEEENMANHADHYSWLRWLGSENVAGVQRFIGNVYYNTNVQLPDATGTNRKSKYGAIQWDDFLQALHQWQDPQVAFRMQKPVEYLHVDPTVQEDLQQAVQANCRHALRAALVLLPEQFDEETLFRTIAGLSYRGDIRTIFRAEDPAKVNNIVSGNRQGFQALYQPLIGELIGTHLTQLDKNAWEQNDDPAAHREIVSTLPPAVRQRCTFGPNADRQNVRNQCNAALQDACWTSSLKLALKCLLTTKLSTVMAVLQRKFAKGAKGATPAAQHPLVIPTHHTTAPH